jgi:hypothetical protein
MLDKDIFRFNVPMCNWHGSSMEVLQSRCALVEDYHAFLV